MTNRSAKSVRASILKDFAPIVIASLAFLLSIGQAYYTVVRQKDDVRAVVTQFPYAVTDSTAHSIAVEGAGTLTFANTGNISDAILLAALTIVQPATLDTTVEKELCSDVHVQVNYDFEPIVLKPGEIVTRRIERFREVDEVPGIIGKDGKVRAQLSPNNFSRDRAFVRFCWQFVVLARDGMYKTREIPIVEFNLPKTGEAVFGTPLFRPNVPIILHSRESTIFSND